MLPGDFTVSEGHGHPLVIIKEIDHQKNNIGGSFICPQVKGCWTSHTSFQ